MDNIHSELIGSFIRRNNSPIEANYIFNSVDELKEFYSKPENKFILHQGLFKVVANEEGQDLYWIYKNDNDELEFKLLLENKSKENLDTVIKDLEDEIKNRIEADDKLRGSENLDDFPENLKDLLSVSELLNKINDYLKDNMEEGGTLKDHIQGIIDLIMGDPYPSDDYNSFRKIQDVLTYRKNKLRRIFKDIQDEIDTIESSVGLSANGSYEPPQDSNFIKGTVSVMHAVKVLDSLINEAINHTKLKTKATPSLDLEVSDLTTGTQIKGNVILDQEGDLSQRDGGIYLKTRIKLDGNNLILEVNDRVVNTVDLGVAGVLHDVKYDSENEQVVISFKLTTGEIKEVKLPMHSIIEEWEVDNSDPNKVVVLNRERNINGKDKLSADIRIAEISDNILEKVGNALYVKASSIKDSDIELINDKLITIVGNITKIESNIKDLNDNLKLTNEAISNIEEKQETLSKNLDYLSTYVEEEFKNTNKSIKDLNDSFLDYIDEIYSDLDKTSKLLNKVHNAQKKKLPEISALIEVVNNLTTIVNEIAFWEEGHEILDFDKVKNELLQSLSPNGDGTPCDENDMGCPLNDYWKEESPNLPELPDLEIETQVGTEFYLGVFDGDITTHPEDIPTVNLMVDWGDGNTETITNTELKKIERPNGYYTLGLYHEYILNETNESRTIKITILDKSEIEAPELQESWGNTIIIPKKYIKFKEVSYNQTTPDSDSPIIKATFNSVKNDILYELFLNFHEQVDITIGSNVKEIETSALSSVKTSELTIPSTVEKLNARIFGNNKIIQHVYVSQNTLDNSHEDWNKVGNDSINYTIQ